MGPQWLTYVLEESGWMVGEKELQRGGGGGRILFVTVYNIKRKVQIHTKKAWRKGMSTRKGHERKVKDDEGPTYEAGGL